MADFFTPAQLDLLSASTVRCDFLVTFDFASGVQRAWNGNTPLVVGGQTYLPMKGYGSIEGLGMSGQGTTSEAITMTLSGLPENVPGPDGQPLNFLRAALLDKAEVTQRIATVALQLFDADWQPVGIPVPLFWGFMQPPKIGRTDMEGVEGAIQTVSISAENIFFGRSRPRNGRNTDRDQQARSPGDKFFGFVWRAQSYQITYPDY